MVTTATHRPWSPPVAAYRPGTYHKWSELEAHVEGLARACPDLVRVVEVGRTPGGRRLLVVELTDRSTGEPLDKPAVWLDGNTHAAELAGAEVCLYTAMRLCAEYGEDPAATRLLRERTLYLMPRVNPDGAEWVLERHLPLRSVPRPWPPGRAVDGLQPADIDGDGRVLQMRVESPGGAWKESPVDPRVLIPREPGDDEGPFYHLYVEGRWEGDWDPDLLEVPGHRCGLDLNRNYPYGWRPEHWQAGAGPYPLSEPESRAQVDAFLARPNIAAVLTFHTYCGVLLRPYSDRPDEDMDTFDLALHEALGRKGTELTGYPCFSPYNKFRYDPKETISGCFDDWVYNHQGAVCFTVELWNVAREAGIAIDDPVRFYFHGDRTPEETAAIARWCADHAPGALVDWYSFDHPQLGRVELGGWNRIWAFQNPPAGDPLERECARVFAFVRAVACSTPRLVVRRAGALPLGDGAWKLDVVVENVGYLPTSATRQGRLTGARPVTAQLVAGDDVAIVSGKRRQELGHLAGAADVVLAPMTDAIGFQGRAHGSVARARWVVRGGKPPWRVEVDGGRAGRVVVNVGAQEG